MADMDNAVPSHSPDPVARPAECPECSSERVASLIYGYVIAGEELRERIERDEVALGGCDISAPYRWQCNACLHQWDDRTKEVEEIMERARRNGQMGTLGEASPEEV